MRDFSRMIRLVLVIFLLFWSCVSFSQSLTQTVKGRVLDHQAKTPIIGATVIVIDSDPIQGAVTDSEGFFSIKNVLIGRRSIRVSSIGYESNYLSNISVTSGKQVVLELEMKESLTEMEAVQVIAEKKGELHNEMAAVSAISLSVEETSRYAATFGDPARAALSQAGVTTGGDDLMNEIVIRGNSPKGILWRLEGIEIPNPNHFAEVGSSAGGVSMLSANALSNSDFYTGAFPAQYGNATSGIFDLRLRKGNIDQHEHGVQVGMLGLAAHSEGPLSKHSNASYLVNYRYSTLGLFQKLGISILGNQENIAFQDLSFKLYIPSKNLGSFSIWGLGGANTYAYKADTINTSDYYFEDEGQSMGVVGVTHIGYLSKNTHLESILSASGYIQNHLEDSLRLQVNFKESIKQNQVRLASMLNHKVNARNTLRFGGIFSRLNFNMESEAWHDDEEIFVNFLDEKGGTNFYQTYAQWKHRLSTDIDFNLGIHHSYFGLNNKSYLEPRAGLRWQINPKSTITSGLGLHSRMESLALYIARSEQEDGSEIQNNRNLGFTRAFHTVLGFERMLKPGLRLKSEIYFQYLFDVPVWPIDTISNMEALTFSSVNSYDGYTNLKLSNDGTGKNYGVELTLEKFFSNNYYFMTTGSLYQSKYTAIDEVERNTVFNGNYVFNLLGGKEFLFKDGRNVLGLNGRFILAGAKRDTPILLDESRTMGYTVKDFTRIYEERLPAYVRFDIGVSFKRNRPKVSSVYAINIQNVIGYENVAYSYYANRADRVEYATQVGIFPNLSYKIEF